MFYVLLTKEMYGFFIFLHFGKYLHRIESPDEYPSSSSTPIGRRGSYKTSRGWWWFSFINFLFLDL